MKTKILLGYLTKKIVGDGFMTESPNYMVEKKEDNIEIRVYDPYILAQVDIEADYDTALRRGFSILAGYIFGANHQKRKIPMTTPVSGENLSESVKIPMTVPVTEEELGKSEKIDMTIPVTEEQTGEHIYRISFTMPSKYSLDTLPVPEDDRIKFKEYKKRRMAVIRFSGRAKEKLAHKEIEELRRWLKKNNLNPKSNFIVAQYNHPAVPGFFRRNEILVEI